MNLIKARLTAILSFLIPAAAVLSYPIRDRFFLSSDLSLYFVAKRWFWDRVAEGEWPLWNEHLFGGFYQLASPVHEIFSPLTSPFYWILPGYWPMIASLSLAAALGGLGSFVLGRFLKLEEWEALAFSLALSLSGICFSLLDRSILYLGLSLYPWLALLSLKMIREGGRLTFLLWALLHALLIHHSDLVGAGFFGICLLIGSGLSRERKRAAPAALAGLTLSFLLSAIVLLPALGNLAWTERAHPFTFEFASHFSLHPVRLLQTVFGELWGTPANGRFWGQAFAGLPGRFWYDSIYLSVPFVLLVLLSLAQASRRQVMAGWAVAALTLTIALGEHAFLHSVLFDYVPGYSRLRYPEKFVLLSLAGLALAASAGIARLRQPKTWLIFWLSVGAVHLLTPLVAYWLQTSQTDPALLREARLLHFGFAFGAFLISALPKRGVFLAAFIAADLLAFSPHRLTAPLAEFQAKPQFIPDTSQGRLLQDYMLDFASFRKGLLPNWGVLDGVHYAEGYENASPEITPYLGAFGMLDNLKAFALPLNIKYVQVPLQGIRPALQENLRDGFLRIIKQDGAQGLILEVTREPEPYSAGHEIKFTDDAREALANVLKRGQAKSPVYLNKDAVYLAGEKLDVSRLPDFAGQTGAPISVVPGRRSNDYKSFALALDGNGVFILRDRFHPGWRAYIDGQMQPTVQADGYNLAVPVSAGRHQLELRFEPVSWRIGLSLTLLGLAIFLMLAASLSLIRLRR